MRRTYPSVVLGLMAVTVWAGPRDAAWKSVEEAERKGRPKTAIEQVEPIIKGALADKAYAEAVKAIAKKISLEGDIQGRKAEEKIIRLQAEVDRAPQEIKPVLETVLAHWYRHFFRQNRWRFMQRTQTGQAPGEDILSWDLPRILKEIDKHFVAALAHRDVLRRIPIAEYEALLAKGNTPDSYRPTLYDFLAHEALGFYSAGEQAAAKAQDAFEVSADSPVFAPLDEFLKWKIETTDQDSPAVKALRLFQELLAFHQDDKESSALIDTDLLRLQYGYNEASGERKDGHYKAALKRFVYEWADHPVSALALHAWAQVLHGEGEFVEAHRLATRGAQAFKDTPGGNRCHNLVRLIEAKSVQIETERVWNKPWPEIRVRYRNLNKVYYRVVPFDWPSLLEGNRWNPEQFDHGTKGRLLNKAPVKQWTTDLPPTTDYQEREETAGVPKDLAPGFYVLVASHDPGFGDQNNQVSYSGFWVSDLALVMRSNWGSGRLAGFVLNALTGEPIEGADIRSWHRAGNGGWTGGPSARTDANGLFQIGIGNGRSHMVLAKHQGWQVSSAQYSDRARDTRAQPHTRTVFFTDRSLYRPGQTVRYKGICYRVDPAGDDYQVLPGQSLTVVFNDGNGKEIVRRTHNANGNGSFSGSFMAPRDRLMGQMHIMVEGEPRGTAYFRVEEYKRPRFKVTVDAPKVAAKLDGEVKLEGHATSYTGAPVDGAAVRYRVVREVRRPDWWYWRCWWYPPSPAQSREIAHGSARTATDGSFEIAFSAAPDRSVNEKDEPTFRFTVYADVTDPTGETRSGQRAINVGYTALRASLSAKEWQEQGRPVEITISTQTLDGEGQAAGGVLKIHRLKQPETVQRARLQGVQPFRPRRTSRTGATEGDGPPPDPANPNSWELADAVTNITVQTGAEGTAGVTAALAPGFYRGVLETQDRFKKKVTALLPISVLDPRAKTCALRVPHVMAAPKWSVEPGDAFLALWGSGYDKARAFVELEHRGKMLRRYWTAPDRTQEYVEQTVDEAMRGGFTLHVTMVRENRAYLTSRKVDVPWSNKKLEVAWEHFTSKLAPGQKETWSAVVTGPDAKEAVAELVAGLYDESLDQYTPHNWMQAFNVFRQDRSRRRSQFENSLRNLSRLHGGWPTSGKNGTVSYRSFPGDVLANWYWGGVNRLRSTRAFTKSAAPHAPEAAPAMASLAMDGAQRDRDGNGLPTNGRQASGGGPGGDQAEQTAASPPGPDLSQVTARKNLQETAFFFPHLVSDADGKVKLEFTMPEALTRWKFMGFAHDGKLRSGFLQDSVVTAKDIMVQPNPPRFLREGDTLEFTVKVINQSPTSQKGTVRLTLADARTLKSVDDQLFGAERLRVPAGAGSGAAPLDQQFEIPPRESRSYAWRLSVPDGMGFLQYKAVASTGKLSDGEEGYLPVLPRRILVTESLPLPIRKATTKKFQFEKLRQSGKSDTLRHQSLIVQMVSNPSWYAVMALPYLIESPHECSEQVFNRLYANALARHIALSDPKIRRIFDQWKGTEALDSPLEKNQDIKAVMLEETPWFRQAQDESRARRNVGILFDDNRLDTETAALQRKLAQMQRGDGLWPWFPGGRGNEYMTLYITTGYGRVRHLGVKGIDLAPAVKSLNALDAWIDKIYRDILRDGHKDDNHLSSTIALYLYGRSFFLADRKINPNHTEAVDYFLGQAKQYWLKLPRQSQGHLALGLQRFGKDKQTPRDIMVSIREYSVTDEELGMFWRDTELSWWWCRAPIETQAVMIEAFDEVAKDATAVEDLKVWLLKQKQTQDWKTTKATADAVYALLLRGTDLLASDALVEVALAGELIKPEKVEAGTGFYEQRFTRGEIKPAMGEITVTKVDEGVAWGSVHWQYFEDMSKITPHEGTPLTLQKALFVKENTKKGPVLTPVKDGRIKVGDELVVRVVLRVDRDMEYVHMKDQRGSGTEPVNVLSQYRYQDGLRYYESTRDTASHFFIDYLPKGTYVFEYSTRVQHKGRYQSGMAQIQCMYAPEFNSHSASYALKAE